MEQIRDIGDDQSYVVGVGVLADVLAALRASASRVSIVVKKTTEGTQMEPGFLYVTPASEDITLRRGRIYAIRDGRNRLAELQYAALEAVATGVFIADSDGTILWVNEAFAQMTGYSSEQIAGQPARVLLSGSSDAVTWDSIWSRAREGYTWRGEAVKQHRDGHLIPVRQTVMPVTGRPGAGGEVLVMLDDIADRKQAEWHTLHTAQYDSLTGLPNRNLLQERLDQSMGWAGRHGRRAALLLLDLDQFKDTNDTAGHLIGDSLLVAVARRLEARAAPADTVSRLGGDEFAVFVEDASSDDALAEYAQRILSAFREPFPLPHQTVTVTASMGVAVYPQDGATANDLMRAADIAMYKAKSSSGNTYRFYDAATDRQTAERVYMVRELRAAFQNRSLHLAFQPQIDLATGRVAAAEALIRWRHETLGDVSPAQLIRLAEASGLIHTLGDWVLDEVCRQIRQWREEGLPVVPVAVNLSAMQLTEDRTADHLLEPLSRYGVEGGLLMVEITESALLEYSDRVFQTLTELHEAGVSLVLDDFGTGYGSLTYLRRYPVSCIKVDVSFVQGVGNSQSDEEIITAMLSLARALKIKVVAEGVETRQQAEFLRVRACDAAQGFYFGRPMMAGDFAALLARRETKVQEQAAG